VVIYDDATGNQNDDWRRRTKYCYSGRIIAYDELRDEVETMSSSQVPSTCALRASSDSATDTFSCPRQPAHPRGAT
jgi:hypothetical protein